MATMENSIVVLQKQRDEQTNKQKTKLANETKEKVELLCNPAILSLNSKKKIKSRV